MTYSAKHNLAPALAGCGQTKRLGKLQPHHSNAY